MRWPTVQGQVLTRSVEERRTFTRRGNVITYVPKLRYEFEIAGQGYQSDSIQLGLKDVGTCEETEQIIGAMAPGAPVQVHYDPEYPQFAVLQSAGQRPLQTIMGAVLLFAIPFVVAISRGLGR